MSDEAIVEITPDKLRYIAKSLDLLARFTTLALPLVRVNGKAPTSEDLEALREWTEGTEQQDDLRRWADALEEGWELYRPEECAEAIVIGAANGPRYDAIHPMNAPWGAYADLSLMQDEAPEVGRRYRLVPVPAESEEG